MELSLHAVGPYIISSNDTKIFLTVIEDTNSHAFVFGSQRFQDAAHFYILRTDCGSRPNEFHITWKSNEVNGTTRYLSVDCVTGNHDGPLCLDSRGKKQHSLFSLNSQLTESLYRFRGSKTTNVNPKTWFQGNESFLIR